MLSGFKVILFGPATKATYSFGMFNSWPNITYQVNNQICPAPTVPLLGLSETLITSAQQIPNDTTLWSNLFKPGASCTETDSRDVIQFGYPGATGYAEGYARFDTELTDIQPILDLAGPVPFIILQQVGSILSILTKGGVIVYQEQDVAVPNAEWVTTDNARYVDITITAKDPSVNNWWGQPDTGRFGVIVPGYYDSAGKHPNTFAGKPQFINFEKQRFCMFE